MRATFAAKTRGEKSGVESGLSRLSSELQKRRRGGREGCAGLGPLVKLWNTPHTKAIPVGIVGGGGSGGQEMSLSGHRFWRAFRFTAAAQMKRRTRTAAARSFIKAALMGGSRREREEWRSTLTDREKPN